MIIEDTRFGTIEIDDASILTFENGLVGFPEQDRFVLLERKAGKMIAYLQSVNTPALAFPIVDAQELEGYPDPTAAVLAKAAGIEGEEFAVFVIVAVGQGQKKLEVNMLAPIIVEMGSRKCAQVVLDARKFSAAQAYAPKTGNDPVAEAKARIASIRQKAAQRSGVAM